MSKIESSKTARANVVERLGLFETSAFDELNPADYGGEDELIDAAIDLTQKRNDTERAALERKLRAELRERQQKEAQEQAEKEYEDIRASITLTADENSRFVAQATATTEQELREGKIEAKNFSKTMQAHLNELTKKAIDSRAANIGMNQLLRRAWQNR